MKALFSMMIAGTLCLGSALAGAQSESATTKRDNDAVQTIYLRNLTKQNDAIDITNALRNTLDPNVKVYLLGSQNVITLRGAPDQIALAQKLVAEFDLAKKSYRLTYTVTEMDEGKRIGLQHFSMVVVTGGRTVLKEGTRIPVVTGAYRSSAPEQKNDVTYLDVGLNIDATLDGSNDGVRLNTKIEQSSVAQEQSSVGLQDPLIRQTLIEGTAILVQGKTVSLGSLDIPGSTRHLEIEVVMEPVR